jgi:hypothetical protein
MNVRSAEAQLGPLPIQVGDGLLDQPDGVGPDAARRCSTRSTVALLRPAWTAISRTLNSCATGSL